MFLLDVNLFPHIFSYIERFPALTGEAGCPHQTTQTYRSTTITILVAVVPIRTAKEEVRLYSKEVGMDGQVKQAQ